jgi:DNA polymerase alpha-associated DNA helicase A
MSANVDDLTRFLARQKHLLLQERNAEIERTSLLLSKCSQKILEQRGLALGALGVASMGVGLGGKTCVRGRTSGWHGPCKRVVPV